MASTVISRNERYRWGRRNRRAEFLKLISHVYLFIKLRYPAPCFFRKLIIRAPLGAPCMLP